MTQQMSEDEIDEMSNDGRLGALAKWLAIQAGADWPSLDGDAQDAWHERAIEHLRSGGEAADEKSAVARGILIRPRHITLAADQLAALRTFADANGRDWKSKLNHAWSTGRYRDYSGTEQDGCLQQVRNTFGPSWLVKFSFDNVKTHSIKR